MSVLHFCNETQLRIKLINHPIQERQWYLERLTGRLGTPCSKVTLSSRVKPMHLKPEGGGLTHLFDPLLLDSSLYSLVLATLDPLLFPKDLMGHSLAQLLFFAFAIFFSEIPFLPSVPGKNPSQCNEMKNILFFCKQPWFLLGKHFNQQSGVGRGHLQGPTCITSMTS